MVRRFTTGLLLSAGVGLLAPASLAENHTFSGTICRSTASGVQYSQFGIANGSSLGNATAICPLVVDYTPGGALLQSALATVYDRSSASDVSCTLTITDLNGNTLHTATRNTNGANSPNPINLRWASIGPTSGAFGILTCTLPASTAQGSSFLTTYSIQ